LTNFPKITIVNIDATALPQILKSAINCFDPFRFIGFSQHD